MRLIDADALRERKFVGVATWTPTEATSWQRGWNDAIDTILEAQPTVDPVKWIPVSKRLPKEEKMHYWVCTDTGYQCQCRWTNDVYGLGASDRWEWKIFDIPQYQKVVAWMPLPEPWRGEEDEDNA